MNVSEVLRGPRIEDFHNGQLTSDDFRMGTKKHPIMIGNPGIGSWWIGRTVGKANFNKHSSQVHETAVIAMIAESPNWKIIVYGTSRVVEDMEYEELMSKLEKIADQIQSDYSRSYSPDIGLKDLVPMLGKIYLLHIEDLDE